ncbi:TonB-dependent receptor [Enterovibrio paralichthyis]|uniref:TonB-dependent receptor n=1 Tax=Enterovibrio paralichthyis TaxID=2853805 RepID=UPI001C448D5A|nr:TonB-dependent receptor [Enterovibrio paralichthyis]MBV7297232.1 TonB-dependent receptor [Enterovibrio paralichthyis]
MSLATRLLATGLLLCSTTSWASSFSLPIWKEEAESRGYVLPKPIGLNLSYMSMEQGIAVDSIAFDGLAYKTDPSWLFPNGLNIPIAQDMIDISAAPGRQKSEVLSLRADVWIFPFLNVYGMVGKLTGYSETDVTIDGIRISDKIYLENPNPEAIPFRLDLDGNLYGGGFVLAGGYGNWFGLVDASYTQTELTVVDGAIDAIVVSPRVGYDFTKKGLPLRLWAGAMYQDVEQSLSGSLSSLDLPAGLSGLLGSVNKDNEGRFNVEQRLTTPWNPIVGMQYQISPNLYLLGEVGLGDRQSLFLTVDMRY